MNMEKRQTAILGGLLIILGVVWVFNLWWLLPPAVLATAGVAAYVQRRRLGRVAEGVQVALWAIGMAILLLVGFVFPGVLFLAGLSLLTRGREGNIDARIQELVAQVQLRAPKPYRKHTPPAIQEVPINTVSPTGEQYTEVVSKKTTRLW